MDIAASIQGGDRGDHAAQRAARPRADGSAAPRPAGGVALNCVGNGRILREAGYDQIWIQPRRATRAGPWERRSSSVISSSTTRAARTACTICSADRCSDRPAATPTSATSGLRRREVSPSCTEASLTDAVAEAIATENVVGHYHGGWSSGRGRSGHGRSSATPARRRWQSVMNLKIKFRESFRPFAPSVLREHVHDCSRCGRRKTARTCCWWPRCATRTAAS